jgi:hypothetical protein
MLVVGMCFILLFIISFANDVLFSLQISCLTLLRSLPIRPPHTKGVDIEKYVEGQWSSIREEYASEHERLASALEEWESKVRNVETDLGAVAAKPDAGLVNLAALQQQPDGTPGLRIGIGNGDVIRISWE